MRLSILKWLKGTFSRFRTVRRPAERRARLGIEHLEARAVPATFQVINTADSGAGSLRNAIMNADSTPGANAIQFKNFAPSVVSTIKLLSPLPAITNPVLLDATTAPGYLNSPLVQLDGTNAGAGANGLVLNSGASGSLVKGFAIDFFKGDGVLLQNVNSTNISLNFIGADPTGNLREGNGNGIELFGGTNNLIGSQTTGQGNVLSANINDGLLVTGAVGNIISGNLIGVSSNGQNDLFNRVDGINLSTGSQFNTIGGLATGASNVVSCNIDAGIVLSGAGTTQNFIEGNFVGTDPNGVVFGFFPPPTFVETKAAQNLGILIKSGANHNIIGGTAIGSLNIISGNNFGIWISDPGTTNNVVLGNVIGTDVTGMFSLENVINGVSITNGATANTIGGLGTLTRNIISGNGLAGVAIEAPGTSSNVVEGNYIGLASDGATALSNLVGVYVLDGASGNTIGGAGLGNVISGNVADGVLLADGGTSFNRVNGNIIGLNATLTATVAVGAGGSGLQTIGVMLFNGPTFNLIGDLNTTPNGFNVISGNGYYGVWLYGSGTAGNYVLGNYLGTTPKGANSLFNILNGVLISNGASFNTIGGFSNTVTNLISGNGAFGVVIDGATTIGNVVANNRIGTNSLATGKLPNGIAGVLIQDQANSDYVIQNTISGNPTGVLISGYKTSNNVVLMNNIGTDFTGMTKLGNTTGVTIQLAASNNSVVNNNISGNTATGVLITDPVTSFNTVQSNRIGVKADISGPLPNGNGVVVQNASTDNTIGGTAPSSTNVISGNTLNGILISDPDTVRNVVAGNYIGTNANVTGPLGNTGDGVLIRNGASFNTVGGASSRNFISGNNGNGLEIVGNTSATVATASVYNVVQFNVIGANLDGKVPLSNGGTGVVLRSATANNNISFNIISGNLTDGVRISNAGTVSNLIQGNAIGTDGLGFTAVGNSVDGVLIDTGASFNTIGGLSTANRNFISGNGDFFSGIGNGVHIVGTVSGTQTVGNVVEGDLIGTNATGTGPVPNVADGVLVENGAYGTQIGGGVQGAANLISGNGVGGNFGASNNVHIDGPSTSFTNVRGDFIGTDSTGTLQLWTPFFFSFGDGVLISNGANNNNVVNDLISGNLMSGVEISGGTKNLVAADYIGVDLSGLKPLPNGYPPIPPYQIPKIPDWFQVYDAGVTLDNAASNNIVGGVGPQVRNVISGNRTVGVFIENLGTDGNKIEGNYIGVGKDGTTPIGNNRDGVYIVDQASNNLIGGAIPAEIGSQAPSPGNVIASNGRDGVRIENRHAAPDPLPPGGNVNIQAGLGNSILGDQIFSNVGLPINYITDTAPFIASAPPVLSTFLKGWFGPPGTSLDPQQPQPTQVGATITIYGRTPFPKPPLANAENMGAGGPWRLEFFASNGASEGMTYLGTFTDTDPFGGFVVTIPINPLPAGTFITATITDSAGDTSMFSNAAKLVIFP